MTKTILIPVLAAATLGLCACGKTETTNTTDTTLILNDDGGAGNIESFDANAVGDNLVVPEENGTDAVPTKAADNAL